MTTHKPDQPFPGILRFRDTCNVYVIVGERASIAIDFGSGAWLRQLPRGTPAISDVFLTHSHPDQLMGLTKRARWPFTIHAPQGEEALLAPENVKKEAARRDSDVNYFPSGYHHIIDRNFRGLRWENPSATPGLGLAGTGVRYDMHPFRDFHFEGRRVCFIPTPGHTRSALTVIAEHSGKRLAFCGDAVHEGSTLHRPFNLEWYHWTGEGALATWQGIERLREIPLDALLPSHGPAITRGVPAVLRKLSNRLWDFYRVKGHICPAVRDRFLPVRGLVCGEREILPGVFHFGENAFLVRSGDEALVIDAMDDERPRLEALLKEIGNPRVTVATATHYHSDHTTGLPMLRDHFGATIWLHPRVAQPIRRRGALDVPYLPAASIKPDRLMPERGPWKWAGLTFRVAPFPGQTWWHACFMARIAGRRVFFGGDNFQPNLRWQGTGGFCAFNGSRFREGFEKSARLVLDWKPEVILNGHGVYYEFQPVQYRKIIAWSRSAERAVRALCPGGEIDTQYHLHHLRAR